MTDSIKYNFNPLYPKQTIDSPPKTEPSTKPTQISKNVLEPKSTDEPKPLTGKNFSSFPDFVLGLLGIKEFKTLEDYNLTQDEMSEHIDNALSQITDSLAFISSRQKDLISKKEELETVKSNNGDTSSLENQINDLERRINNSTNRINDGLDNLIVNSQKIAKDYADKEMPENLKNSLLQVLEFGKSRRNDLDEIKPIADVPNPEPKTASKEDELPSNPMQVNKEELATETDRVKPSKLRRVRKSVRHAGSSVRHASSSVLDTVVSAARTSAVALHIVSKKEKVVSTSDLIEEKASQVKNILDKVEIPSEIDINPETMEKTIKMEQVPFLLTGVVDDLKLVQSFQKHGAYLLKPEEMAPLLNNTLDFVNQQTNPEAKKVLMEELVTSSINIAKIYKTNTSQNDLWTSSLPTSIAPALTNIANAALEINLESGNGLSKEIETKEIPSPEEMGKMPQVSNEEELKNTTKAMMDRIRSGEMKKKDVKNAVNELRLIESYYLGSAGPNQFYKKAWENKDASPHGFGFGIASDFLSNQIFDDILATPTGEKLTEQMEKKNLNKALHIMEFYCEVMDACIDEGNYAAANSIWAALGSPSTTNMFSRAKTKGYKESPSKNYLSKMERANQLFEPIPNYKNLRSGITNLQNSCLLPIALTSFRDLLFIEESNQSIIENKINSEKLLMESNALNIIEKNKPEIPSDYSQLKTRFFNPQFNLRSTGQKSKGVEEFQNRLDNFTISRPGE